MDRIHRLGQKRPVKVVKLVIEDSIEDQVSVVRSSRTSDLTLLDRSTAKQEVGHDRCRTFEGPRRCSGQAHG